MSTVSFLYFRSKSRLLHPQHGGKVEGGRARNSFLWPHKNMRPSGDNDGGLVISQWPYLSTLSHWWLFQCMKIRGYLQTSATPRDSRIFLLSLPQCVCLSPCRQKCPVHFLISADFCSQTSMPTNTPTFWLVLLKPIKTSLFILVAVWSDFVVFDEYNIDSDRTI